MTRFIKWLFILFFLIGVVLGILAVNSLENYSAVTQPAPLSDDELNRVKQFIKANNPANLNNGQMANSQINQQDLNHLLNYLSQKAPHLLRQRLRLNVVFEKDQAFLQSSLHLPDNPLGEYINISATLHTTSSALTPEIEVRALQIGNNNVPDFIATWLASALHQQLVKKAPEYKAISDALQTVAFSEQMMRVEYIWDTQAAEKMKNQLSARVIPDEFREALIAHANHLAKTSHALPAKATFNQLLKSMFSYAKLRSKEHDPIIENRALFIAMGAYSLNKNIPELFGEIPEKVARSKRISLKQRYDLSKHLMLSAAITSMADSGMAISIGLQKEVKDSQGGSGFSFADLAADLAGIALAEKAIASTADAIKMQNILSSDITEQYYMPDIGGLPEGLEQAEFERQYVSTQSPAYKKIEQLIADRIDALPLYREVN